METKAWHIVWYKPDKVWRYAVAEIDPKEYPTQEEARVALTNLFEEFLLNLPAIDPAFKEMVRNEYTPSIERR